VAASANPVCSGTSVTFTATPVNGGTTPAYQWKVNGTDVPGATNVAYSFVPASGNAVACVLTSNATCPTGNPATSNTITMTVNPLLPVSVSVASSANPVCAGTSVTYTATPVNGGTTPLYQWKVNGSDVPGATNVTYSFVPSTGNTVSCVLTSNATCPVGSPSTSNIVSMMVNPLLPVSIAITSTANSVCAGTEVTYFASPVNGGSTPLYQWNINGLTVNGATNSTYTYIPDNYDVITCNLTSNAVCPVGNPAISNSLTMEINPLVPVNISIESSNNQVCAGSAVSFTAIPENGGTNPLYQWYINNILIPGATDVTYSYIPQNNDAVTCRLISNESCAFGNPAISNVLNIVVNPILTVSLRVAASTNPVCAEIPVMFTSVADNGGSQPAYQWQVNYKEVQGATNSTYEYIPENSDIVSCFLISSAVCTLENPVLSNEISMTVNPYLAVSLTIDPSANPVCSGTEVTFTTTPINEGLFPVYQWSINGVNATGATNSTYIHSPIDNDAVTCHLISSEACTLGNTVVSNTVNMGVHPVLPVSISIQASANSICAGTPVTFTATTTNEGTNPSYVWKVNGISIAGATSSTFDFTPSNGNKINCTLVSSELCTTGNPAISNTVNMVVNPILPVSLGVTASANPVLAGTLVTFTANPTNEGISPSYSWKVNGSVIPGATSTVYSYIPEDQDHVICMVESSEVCAINNPASSSPVIMTVTIVPATIVLQGIEVTGIQCYGASQTITVAGNGSTFIVQSGGSATMIAGHKISYLPGTSVKPGGFMHGYITLNGQFCGSKTPAVGSVVQGEELNSPGSINYPVKVYPNPTDGIFVVKMAGINGKETVMVKIYSMTGEIVLSQIMNGGPEYHISLSGKPEGIYLVQVNYQNKQYITRLIKQ
ncbi:MAG: T9SS type A sorting domain-containing protein, partial [Bacteroidales bacterium]